MALAALAHLVRLGVLAVALRADRVDVLAAGLLRAAELVAVAIAAGGVRGALLFEVRLVVDRLEPLRLDRLGAHARGGLLPRHRDVVADAADLRLLARVLGLVTAARGARHVVLAVARRLE